jgi:hypothetical protein
MGDEPILFIDSNIYILLYGALKGSKYLDSLEAWKAYIFVTKQVVEEVCRNKLTVAYRFYLERCKQLELVTVAVPDHAPGLRDDQVSELQRIDRQAKVLKEQISKTAAEMLPTISRSEDEISRRLDGIFDKAVSPSPRVLRLARDRRDRGNPPGKQENPLGDQISWEQLLIHCKGQRRIWIITNDRDYNINYNGDLTLNLLLYKNLKDVCGANIEVHCFDKLKSGLDHFAKHSGVGASALPPEEEAKEIQNEMDALKLLRPMTNFETANMTAVRMHHANRGGWGYVVGPAPADEIFLMEPGRVISYGSPFFNPGTTSPAGVPPHAYSPPPKPKDDSKE